MQWKLVLAAAASAVALAGCGSPAVPAPQAPDATAGTGQPSGTPAAPGGAPSAAPTQDATGSATSTPAKPKTPRPSAPQDGAWSSKALLNAPVPSLCEHKAGRLVNGRLTGIPTNQGHVNIATIEGGEWRKSVAEWTDAGKQYAAVVFACSQGGVAWPDEIVVYTNGPKVVGKVSTLEVLGDGRQTVQRIFPDGGGAAVQVSGIYQEGDAGCCGTGDGSFMITATGGKVQVEDVSQFNEVDAAQHAFVAAQSGDRAELTKASFDDQAVASGLKVTGLIQRGTSWSDVTCQSITTHPDPPTFSTGYERLCTAKATGGDTVSVLIGMKHTGFATWKAAGFHGVGPS